MAARTDLLDLASLRLRPGEGRRLVLDVPIEPLELGGDPYAVTPDAVPATLDVSRMSGGGWSLRVRFEAEVRGPCMRCLDDAAPRFAIDAREISQRDSGPELDSPYVQAEVVDVGAWARDALVLALPTQIVCDPACPGLCPDCGERLADLPADHAHERPVDPRWAKLGELRLE